MISETSSRQPVWLDVGETVLIGCPLNRTNAHGCEWYKVSFSTKNKNKAEERLVLCM